MAEKVPASGTCAYNGITFGAFTESDVEATPVYDEAQRTVIYTVYRVNIDTIVHSDIGSGTTTDAQMLAVRRALEHPGGAFQFENKGFGSLSVNLGADSKDVVWGPKPRVLKWVPRGNTGACRVNWTVEVAIPECANAQFAFAFMEMNYRMSWSIDAQSGYTKRTYRGHLKIPQTRASISTRTISDDADLYRERINPQCPMGFRRIARDFDLSLDKCRLDFTIVDEEMPPQVPQNGVVQCDAKHTLSSSDKSIYRWVGTITATYELAREVGKEQAWPLFRDLVISRLEEARLNNKGVFFLRLSIEDTEIFGRKAATFNFSYVLIFEQFSQFFASTGLWKPVPNTDWNLWRASVDKPIFSPRGNAELYHRTENDAIVDLCLQSPVSISAGGGAPINPFSLPGQDIPQGCPPPDRSWLLYESRLEWEEKHNVIEMTPLPKSQPYTPGGGGPTMDPSSTQGYQIQGTQTPSIVQTRAEPTRAVYLIGRAARACYKIDAPRLNSINGEPVTPANEKGDGFIHAIGGHLGVPIYVATWRLRYIVSKSSAGTLGVPTSPTFVPPTGGDFI